jgi:hypothetical protein
MAFAAFCFLHISFFGQLAPASPLANVGNVEVAN